MCGYWAARSVLRRVFWKRVEKTTPLPESARHVIGSRADTPVRARIVKEIGACKSY